MSWRATAVRACALAAVLAFVVCSASAATPVIPELRDLPRREPVVLVPGLTGVELRDRVSGRVAWGNARSLFWPRDGGRGLALPIDDGGDAEDELIPSAPILALRFLGLWSYQVYDPVVRLMERNGYRLGDLGSPRPDDSFFIFVYDWRRGAERAAAELERQLDALRKERSEPELRVTLICQSNAALIGRWLVKYGAGTIEDAEAAHAGPLAKVRVTKLILVGPANGGSLRVLGMLDRGRRYFPWIGKRWRPETLFTFPSLYEALPAYRKDLFFDVEGRIVDVDLFDAQSWRRNGWSIFDADGERFLDRMLDRARRLHRMLERDPGSAPLPRYYMVQGGYRASPERFLLVDRNHRGIQTLDHRSARVRRDPYLRSLARSPGDGHATLASQLWLSPRERAALAVEPVYVSGGHFEVILDPGVQRHILGFLLDGD